MDERTEAPPPVVDGQASEVPPAFYWSLWIGAFAVVLWGMFVLFGRGRREPPDEG